MQHHALNPKTSKAIINRAIRLDGHRGRTASFSALYQMNRKKKKKSKPKWVKRNPKAQAPRKLAVHVEIYPRRRTTRLMKHSHARTNNKRERQQPVF
jgi:hypothetical protein